MDVALVSLFWIMLVAVLAPLIASAVPGRAVPEVVLLIGAGVLLGPHVLDLAGTEHGVELVRELGLGMLFLLAGYEIETEELTSHRGRRSMLVWVVCFALAIALTAAAGLFASSAVTGFSAAIVLCATALGTLVPILREKGLGGTGVGRAVMNHGTIGEVGPVLAMAILLGARGTLASLGVLALFVVAAVLIARVPLRAQRASSKVLHVIRYKSETTSQTTVRATMLLLVAMLAVAALLHLDIILGAFAAGFILRRVLPSGDHALERKLEGFGYGFLIPVFFVTSGMAIDPGAVAGSPGLLAILLVALLVVRGLPVFLGERFVGADRLGTRDAAQVGLYAATSLPIIVAVTQVAVAAEAMPSEVASVLVAAGAVSVLVMPLVAGALGASEQGQHLAPVDRRE
ncbi:cation:proton antiporter [Ruania alba]|uniref:Kef-type K+ transport system, membrane component KefB n=1 Tax=Ruania alba TaxID=648782 RepID=A0A1H5M6P4_9MICO|nr:cation:proton antiporter [Ruania alba]SEE84925.1 Kef-type K+ transport system, membrane component KefB [Ruania alba]